MPNWVYNSIVVTGETGEVETLAERLSAPHIVNGSEVSQPFSFWNIIAPTDLEAYSDTVGDGGRSMSDPDCWYNWNCKNWGCKWEASCDEDKVAIENHKNQTSTVSYHFDTAWNQPGPIIDWLASYCINHDLTLEWHYQEEQGWGGEVIVDNSGELQYREWDIPSTHKETKDLDQECVCEYESDEEYWFADCPREESK
jgi:hypothetical protein